MAVSLFSVIQMSARQMKNQSIKYTHEFKGKGLQPWSPSPHHPSDRGMPGIPGRGTRENKLMFNILSAF